MWAWISLGLSCGIARWYNFCATCATANSVYNQRVDVNLHLYFHSGEPAEGEFTRRFAQVLEKLQNIEFRLDSQDELLEQILAILSPGPAVTLEITAILPDGTIQRGITTMTMRDDQQVTLTITPKDKKGKPAQLDGIPVWASSDETVVTVVAAADGLSAVAAGVAPGSGRVTVTGDADLGSGVTPITGVLDVSITGGAAATIDIAAGTPADQ